MGKKSPLMKTLSLIRTGELVVGPKKKKAQKTVAKKAQQSQNTVSLS